MKPSGEVLARVNAKLYELRFNYKKLWFTEGCELPFSGSLCCFNYFKDRIMFWYDVEIVISR